MTPKNSTSISLRRMLLGLLIFGFWFTTADVLGSQATRIEMVEPLGKYLAPICLFVLPLIAIVISVIAARKGRVRIGLLLGAMFWWGGFFFAMLYVDRNLKIVNVTRWPTTEEEKILSAEFKSKYYFEGGSNGEVMIFPRTSENEHDAEVLLQRIGILKDN